MCCRYVLFEGPDDLSKQLNSVFEGRIHYKPNFNVSPGCKMPIVSQNMNGWRTIEHYTWGLLPFWATEEIKAENTTYVQAKTLGNKSKFRPYFTNRRCLIPANGFYIWRKIKSRTMPFYNSFEEGSITTMAGLYSRWKSPTGELIPTFCLVTAASDEPNDRMPAILLPEARNFWLNPGNQNTDELLDLLVSVDSINLTSYAVSDKVDNLNLNNRELILPNVDKKGYNTDL